MGVPLQHRVSAPRFGVGCRWLTAISALWCALSGHASLCLAAETRAAPTAETQAALATALPASEQQEDPEPLQSKFQLHGFVSQGFIKSTDNNYLGYTKRGSFEFAEMGLNLTTHLSDNLTTGVQLFAHDLGPYGNYKPQVDWFYLDYRWRDWLALRVGRTKVPFGLYNELNDVDVARQSILLPTSIYPADHREFLFAQTGGELYGNVPLGPAGALEYRLHTGTFPTDTGGEPPAGVTPSDVSVPFLYGGRAMWSTPLDGLRAGFSLQVVRFDATYLIDPALFTLFQTLMLAPADAPNPFDVKFKVTRWVGSLAYNAYDWDISAEYSRWLGEFDTPLPALFPEHTLNSRYYAMVSYRVNDWFSPGVYYSALYPNVRQTRGHDKYQHDLAFSVRYDLTENWLLKLEGHYMRGTAALAESRSLNDDLEPAQMNPQWGLFLIKTTAYF